MPLITVLTNVPAAKLEAKNFRSDFYALLSKTLKSPNELLALHSSSDKGLSFANSDAPCAIVVIQATEAEHMSAEANVASCKAVAEFIHARLEVPVDRSFVACQKFGATDVRFGGQTIKDYLVAAAKPKAKK